MTRKIWAIALAVFLIIYALLTISNVRFEFQGFLLGILALLAGIMLLLDK